MGKSTHLRVQDVRAIVRLVGECRDLGDDVAVWRRRFLQGASELVGAGVGNSTEWRPAFKSGGQHEMIGVIDWGWHNGFEKRRWDELLQAFAREGPSLSPMFEPYFAALLEDNGVCLTRADLVRNEGWYPSRYYQDYHRPIGADAIMYCHHYSHEKENKYHELTLVRATREPDFSPRDRTIIRELHSAIVSMLGGPLAGFTDPTPSSLSPRQRQVLASLLEGDSDKQIARRLGISGNTVNHHVKAIFRHFAVSSRPELLARWARRGWGRRLGWTE